MSSLKDNPLYELTRLAVQAAIDAPIRQPKYGAKAGVYWTTINDIRAECDRIGIDWKAQHRHSKKKQDPPQPGIAKGQEKIW